MTNILIQLKTPLPCGISNGGDLCGKPAVVAYATQNTHLLYPLSGTWTVQPVCRECALAALAVYEKTPMPSAYVSTAKARSIAAEYDWPGDNQTAIALRSAARRGDIIARNDPIEGWEFEEDSLRLYLQTSRPRKRGRTAGTEYVPDVLSTPTRDRRQDSDRDQRMPAHTKPVRSDLQLHP